MSFFYQIYYRLSYLLEAVNRHSLHTPFIYDFYTNVIDNKALDGNYKNIEKQRKSLLQDSRTIEIEDLGAGSKVRNTSKRSISHIAKYSLSPPRYSALLFRLIKYFGSKKIVELGTSLGINTLYLAKLEATQVVTFEGCESIATHAQALFDKMEMTNVTLNIGNINKKLPLYLDGSVHPDLFFIDANHTYEATMKYFSYVVHNRHDNTIAVFDDIKWSKGMQQAWQEIVAHQQVTLSIDLNQWGIVFFRPAFEKEHYILDF